MMRLSDLLKEAVAQDNVKRLLPYDNSWQSIIEACERIADKTILEREFRGPNWYALEVQSGPWTKGLMGVAFKSEPHVLAKVQQLVDKFDLEHIIYTSHMSRSSLPGFYGERFLMVPTGQTKVIWSSKVRDIYSDLKQYSEKGLIDQFPIDSYQEGWPTQPLTEVLVDCSSYYLVSPARFLELSGKFYPRGDVGKQRLEQDIKQIKTYKDLAEVLAQALNKINR
jgi:hypothetical protein